jgi:inward rectifier potassium channel
MRRIHELRLARGDTPLFTLTFLALHVVDAESPLHGFTPASLADAQVRFVVTVTGLDATFASTIHARRIYHAEDLVWNARFADVLRNLPDGQLELDYAKFHDVVPL